MFSNATLILGIVLARSPTVISSYIMYVANNLLSIGANWCIMRTVTFPAFYWFLSFNVLGIVTVIINRFSISLTIWVYLWITFVPMEIFIRKISCVIILKITVRYKTFLSLFKIISSFSLPVCHTFLFTILFITEILLSHCFF